MIEFIAESLAILFGIGVLTAIGVLLFGEWMNFYEFFIIWLLFQNAINQEELTND